MRRREFIATLVGAATWPMVVRAQQSKRARRVGLVFDAGALTSLVRALLLRIDP